VSTIGGAPAGLTDFCTGFFALVVVFADAVFVVVLLTDFLFGVLALAAPADLVVDLVVVFFGPALLVVVFFAAGLAPLLVSLAI